MSVENVVITYKILSYKTIVLLLKFNDLIKNLSGLHRKLNLKFLEYTILIRIKEIKRWD